MSIVVPLLPASDSETRPWFPPGDGRRAPRSGSSPRGADAAACGKERLEIALKLPPLCFLVDAAVNAHEHKPHDTTEHKAQVTQDK